MSEKTQSLSIPAAIVLAGVIIAIAIIIAFSGGKSAPEATGPTARISIAEAAKEVKVRAKTVEECVANEETLAIVDAHIENGIASGVSGTPYTIAIGPNGNSTIVNGAQPRQVWDELIDAFLAGDVPPAPEDAPLRNVAPVTDADYVRGNVDAPVTLIEFSDIDCPFCQRLHPTLEQLLEDRPEDVRWVYRHFPLTQLHPEAKKKALAVECVGELSQGEKFWEYLDVLIEG